MTERTHKLLVVDDEFLNRYMLKQRLSRSGFDVAEAESAEQALAEIERGGIDLVLLDVMMPGMSGLDLLKLLRAVHGPADLPVIMATAIADSQSIAGALDMGANDYITKPIDYHVALARIQTQLERRDSELVVRQSEERYALASRGTEEGIWDWDLMSDRMYLSPRWKRSAGYAEDDIGNTAREWFSRVHPDDRIPLRSRLDDHWRSNAGAASPFTAEYRLLHKDGSYRWMRASAYTVRDPEGRALRMTGSQADITQQKAFDPLTGLPNRLLFLERAGQALATGERCAVMFLDVDRFKLVNDSMGHMAGDSLLVALSRRLREGVLGDESAGRDPVVARFGGDEFAVLLAGIAGPRDAECAASRVLEALFEPVSLNGKEVFCNVSIGIAYADTALPVDDLLRDADTAMYAAKSCGGGRYAIFDETMRKRVAVRLEIETGLRKAVERNELVVHYQPKVHLDSGRLIGFEALVRWMHPALGMIGPNEFIPIAEETGAIVPIGAWVTREACRQMAYWQARFPKHLPLTVSVNLSVRQFSQPDLVDSIARILAETGLSASSLQLEITESIVMHEPESAIVTVGRLKQLGVGIQLDDFGTGYSSLSYLCRMPLDALKIDRSFITRMPDSPADAEIVRTVLALARSLGMEAIAEGIEQDGHTTQLRELGCQFGQGYCFGRPISPEETEALLALPAEQAAAAFAG